MPVEKDVGGFLIPREPTETSLELEQKLVLAAGQSGAERCVPDRSTFEAQQHRRMVLERPTGNEGAEVRQHLGDPRAADVLGEIEPVGAEICRDVGRPGALGHKSPALRHEQRVVADVAAVDDPWLAELALGHARAHVLDERVAADVIRDGSDTATPLERGEHALAFLDARRQRLLTDHVRAVVQREQGLLGVQRVRRADVHHVDLRVVQELLQPVVHRHGSADLAGKLVRAGPGSPADGNDPAAQVAHRICMNSGHEPGAHDRGAELAHPPAPAFRNICVRTSMSSRACSGGVRHSLPLTTQSWKWRSSRAKLSS